jgi:site-specific DNA-methyltransferase (adenine-specific)/site-specific DNA-methyltransferase (cytosine-N4-specific)
MWPQTVDLLTDEDDVPPVPVEPVSKQGDLYILGDHRLLCGDCRDFTTVAKLLDGSKINVAVTSPPYASQRKYDESSGFKPIKPEEYVNWYRDVAANIMANLADDGSYFLNIKEHCEGGQRSLYVKDLTLAHVREWGWQFNDELIWIHGGIPGEVHTKFKNQWEPIFHFTKGQKIKIRPYAVAHESDYVPHGGGGNLASQQGTGKAGKDFQEGVGPGMALPGNVLSIGKNKEALGHAAAFPVALPEFFIKAFSDSQDVIFDPFMGSGTTLMAAEKNGRIAYGTELSPAYCDVIVTRWEQATGKKAVLSAG